MDRRPPSSTRSSPAYLFSYSAAPEHIDQACTMAVSETHIRAKYVSVVVASATDILYSKAFARASSDPSDQRRESGPARSDPSIRNQPTTSTPDFGRGTSFDWASPWSTDGDSAPAGPAGTFSNPATSNYSPMDDFSQGAVAADPMHTVSLTPPAVDALIGLAITNALREIRQKTAANSPGTAIAPSLRRSWTTPLSEIVPGLPPQPFPSNLSDLLSHRSGLPLFPNSGATQPSATQLLSLVAAPVLRAAPLPANLLHPAAPHLFRGPRRRSPTSTSSLLAALALRHLLPSSKTAKDDSLPALLRSLLWSRCTDPTAPTTSEPETTVGADGGAGHGVRVRASAVHLASLAQLLLRSEEGGYCCGVAAGEPRRPHPDRGASDGCDGGDWDLVGVLPSCDWPAASTDPHRHACGGAPAAVLANGWEAWCQRGVSCVGFGGCHNMDEETGSGGGPETPTLSRASNARVVLMPSVGAAVIVVVDADEGEAAAGRWDVATLAIADSAVDAVLGFHDEGETGGDLFSYVDAIAYSWESRRRIACSEGLNEQQQGPGEVVSTNGGPAIGVSVPSTEGGPRSSSESLHVRPPPPPYTSGFESEPCGQQQRRESTRTGDSCEPQLLPPLPTLSAGIRVPPPLPTVPRPSVQQTKRTAQSYPDAETVTNGRAVTSERPRQSSGTEEAPNDNLLHEDDVDYGDQTMAQLDDLFEEMGLS